MKTPRPHQQEAIDRAVTHFASHDRGQLIMACGTGKTLTSLWIAKALGTRRILVTLPSLQLQAQSLATWLDELTAFKFQVLIVGSDESIGRYAPNVIVTTQEAVMARVLAQQGPLVVFSTYHSSPALANACRQTDSRFDLAIVDEAHRTTGHEEKVFATVLYEQSLPIAKRLFMTATPRLFVDAEALSMDDPTFYGERFYTLTTDAAIAQGLLADYKCLVVCVNQADVMNLLAHPRKAQLLETSFDTPEIAMAVAIVRAIDQYGLTRHITFHKSIERAKRFNLLLNHIDPSISTFHLNHTHNWQQRVAVLDALQASIKGVITNVRALNEGFDLPEADAVTFVDVKRSSIDLIQSIGRVLRVSPDKPFGYVILPIWITEKGEVKNEQDLELVRQALTALAIMDPRVKRQLKTGQAGPVQVVGLVAGHGAVLQHITPAFFGQLRLRVWNRFKIFNWLSYEDARRIVIGQHFANQNAYRAWNERPGNIPSAPHNVYAQQWVSWGDWLGNPQVRAKNREWRTYEETKAFYRQYIVEKDIEKLASTHLMNFIRDDDTIPQNVPKSPKMVYPEWEGWPIFLGRHLVHRFAAFPSARLLARRLADRQNIKTGVEWYAFVRDYPEDVPSLVPHEPVTAYRHYWKGWPDWLGKTYKGRKTGPKPRKQTTKPDEPT